MKYLRCNEDINVYVQWRVLKRGLVAGETGGPVLEYRKGEVIAVDELNGTFDEGELPLYFEEIPAINTIVLECIDRARKSSEFTTEVLRKLYPNVVDKELEVAIVIIKKQLANARRGMAHNADNAVEHSALWSKACVFEELLREIERYEQKN